MNWTLQSDESSSEYEMISDDGQKVRFKYSRSQQSVRMRFDGNYGVYVLDEGCFEARKFAIRNVYGSEIGHVSKGLWRETSGTITLDDITGKVNYQIDTKNALLQIQTGSVQSTIYIVDGKNEENYFLSLIVLAWMQAVSVVHTSEIF